MSSCTFFSITTDSLKAVLLLDDSYNNSSSPTACLVLLGIKPVFSYFVNVLFELIIGPTQY